jgi:hypothetical protein
MVAVAGTTHIGINANASTTIATFATILKATNRLGEVFCIVSTPPNLNPLRSKIKVCSQQTIRFSGVFAAEFGCVCAAVRQKPNRACARLVVYPLTLAQLFISCAVAIVKD